MTPEVGIFALLGLKLQGAIASLVGALVALTLTKGLKPIPAFFSLLVGFVTSVFLTPLISSYFEFTATTENGIAFLIGLIGMNLVTGLFSMSKSFSTNPLNFIKSLRGGKNGSD